MLGDGKHSRTAGCVLVPVRVWACLAMPGIRFGVSGIWLNTAWEQTLLGKSCRPPQTLSREQSPQLPVARRGTGLPTPARDACACRSRTLRSSAPQMLEQTSNRLTKRFERL